MTDADRAALKALVDEWVKESLKQKALGKPWRRLMKCTNELEVVIAAGLSEAPKACPRQQLLNDLYRLFTSTSKEIAAHFGESRCKDDSSRINYALELMEGLSEAPAPQEKACVFCGHPQSAHSAITVGKLEQRVVCPALASLAPPKEPR